MFYFDITFENIVNSDFYLTSAILPFFTKPYRAPVAASKISGKISCLKDFGMEEQDLDLNQVL